MFYKGLLLVLFALVFDNLQSFSQTVVIEKHVKGEIYNNSNGCRKYAYDLKLPQLQVKPLQDMRKMANDSIMHIANTFFQMWEEDADCSYLSFGNHHFKKKSCLVLTEDMFEMNYTIFQNNNSLLSILVHRTFSTGIGSGYIGKELFCFNINLKANKGINLDSLFNQQNKEKVLTLLEAQYDKVSNIPYMDDSSQDIKFLGINISDTSLLGYYLNTFNAGRTVIIDVVIPLASVKQYLNEEYSWIEKQKERKEKQ